MTFETAVVTNFLLSHFLHAMAALPSSPFPHVDCARLRTTAWTFHRYVSPILELLTMQLPRDYLIIFPHYLLYKPL